MKGFYGFTNYRNRSENEFFDYEAKYLGKSKEITPARISDELKVKNRKGKKRFLPKEALMLEMDHKSKRNRNYEVFKLEKLKCKNERNNFFEFKLKEEVKYEKFIWQFTG